MTVVTNTWQQLVRRRLWPFALLLVAALVAVPFVLASEPEPLPTPAVSAPAVSTDADDALAEPVVAKVDAEDRSRRRRVLGSRKDPFKPAPVKKAKSATTTTTTTTTTDTQPTTGTPGSTTGTGGSGLMPSLAPPVDAPKPKAPPAGSVTVRFGDAAGDDLPKGVLEKLAPLPDDEEPLIVYLGLSKDGKRAKFLIDAALTPTGDGTCKPHTYSCETVELRRGETEFFDVVDPETNEVGAQYQLDLVAINN
jgi:hypothetical protein